jgi:hypothetical protein
VSAAKTTARRSAAKRIAVRGGRSLCVRADMGPL